MNYRSVSPMGERPRQGLPSSNAPSEIGNLGCFGGIWHASYLQSSLAGMGLARATMEVRYQRHARIFFDR
jgi:hypothetical protein